VIILSSPSGFIATHGKSVGGEVSGGHPDERVLWRSKKQRPKLKEQTVQRGKRTLFRLHHNRWSQRLGRVHRIGEICGGSGTEIGVIVKENTWQFPGRSNVRHRGRHKLAHLSFCRKKTYFPE